MSYLEPPRELTTGQSTIVDSPRTGPLEQVVSSAWEISDQAKEELAQWLEQRGIRVPVGKAG